MLEFFSQGGTYCRAVTGNLKKVKAHSFVTWIEGNLADKKSLYNTIAGSKRLFLTTSFSEKMADFQNNANDLAREARVEHIVKLFTKGVSEKSDFLIPKLHYQIEQKLKSSGLNWTIFQPSAFMQNWLGDFSEAIKMERKIYDAVGDIKMAFIDARDIAEVADRNFNKPQKNRYKNPMLLREKGSIYFAMDETNREGVYRSRAFLS